MAAMDEDAAIEALAALAQGHRMRLFRLLVRRAPDGLSAGEIGAAVALSPSALSFHLAQLQRAGLISHQRRGRHLIYRAELNGMRELMEFLTADCCQGRPEMCAFPAAQPAQKRIA